VSSVGGLVSTQNSAPLAGGMATQVITCRGPFLRPCCHQWTCTHISYPFLRNDVIWQNRSFRVGVGALSPQYQQHIVTLFNASGSTAASQAGHRRLPSAVRATGTSACAATTGPTGGSGIGSARYVPFSRMPQITPAPPITLVATECCQPVLQRFAHPTGMHPGEWMLWGGRLQRASGISDAIVPTRSSASCRPRRWTRATTGST